MSAVETTGRSLSGIASRFALIVLVGFSAKASASRLAQEGWVTHSVALSPCGSVTARGRMHAELGTSILVIERRGTGHRSEIPTPGPIRDIAFVADGERFATAHDDGTVRIWRVNDGAPAGQLLGHEGSVLCVAVSPDGTRLASGGRDGRLALWSTTSLSSVWRSETGESVSAVAFARDGSKLAYARRDDGIRVLDPARASDGTGDRLQGSAEPVVSLEFSPDGKWLAAGLRDGTILLWDAKGPAGTPPHRLTAHGKAVSAVRFSSDGRRFVSTSWDGSVRLFDSATMRCLRVDTGERALGDAIVTADGTVIVVDYDGLCRTHDMTDAR